MKKKIIIISLILLVIIFVLFTLFSIKFYKVNKMINLIKSNNLKNNYSYSIKNILTEKVEGIIKRNKNINFVLISESAYEYYDFKNNVFYIFNNENNICYKRGLNDFDKEFTNFPLYQYLTSDYSFSNKLKLVFEWKIKDYDKDNYEITTKDGYKVIFNKITGLVSRVTSYGLENKVDKIVEDFKENCVTDEETKLPDLNEYSLVENN